MKIIEINLLPEEEAPESPYSIRNIAILVISFLIATFLVLLTWQLNGTKNEYAHRKKNLLQKLAIYKKQKKKIDELQKRKADLEQRYKLVTEVLGQRITWYDKLNVLHKQIPEKVWLSDISMEIQQEVGRSRKKSKPQNLKTSTVLQGGDQPLILFHITGYTTELQKIGNLIANLDSSTLFDKTKFGKIENTTIMARSVISFEMTTRLTKDN